MISEKIPKEIGAAAEMIHRVFPFTQEDGLKIYAIFSAHSSAAIFINEQKAKLLIMGAYNLDSALDVSKQYLDSLFPGTSHEWRNGLLTTSIPYQHVVPIDRIVTMVDQIKNEINPTPTQKESMDAKIDMMEAYCRYVFDKAMATSYEKGILTSVLNRFKSITSQNNETIQKSSQ